MKPVTYFHFALLLPYLLWGLSALVVAIAPQKTSSTWTTLLTPVYFYAFGILLWFLPYTVLAVGLLIWSRNKQTNHLFKAALTAPLVLVVLMAVEAGLVSIPSESMSDFSSILLGQAALLGGFSLVFGYLCVGFALGIYKFLRTRSLIREEAASLLRGS
jgi:hypothetical protein